jgi:adenylosuccinate lyase
LQPLIASEAATPLLGRTHGQAATPTTFGKELAVFSERLRRAYDAVAAVRLSGKLTGATGTFAAHVVALPHVDWPTFSRAFVASFQLEPVLLTTQIEPHDTLAALCDALKRTATIGIDLSQDLWRYISDGYLVQAAVAGEVGSSTMPHKVNPIDFENAEGNLGLAGALFEHFSRKLPISRLQRDLSDSTVLRNLGVASGHLLLGLQRIRAGLARVSTDRERMLREVVAHPEVLAEAFQTILRAAGHPAPYEALRQLTRGQQLTLEVLHRFVATLDVAPQVRDALLALTPDGYTGAAAALARQVLRRDRVG